MAFSGTLLIREIGNYLYKLTNNTEEFKLNLDENIKSFTRTGRNVLYFHRRY